MINMWPKNYSIVALKTILIARTASVSLPVLPIIMPCHKFLVCVVVINCIAAVINGPSTSRKQLFLARASAPGLSEMTVRIFEPLTPNSIQCMFNMTGSASNTSFTPTLQVTHMKNIGNNEGGTDERWKVSNIIFVSSHGQ